MKIRTYSIEGDCSASSIAFTKIEVNINSAFEISITAVNEVLTLIEEIAYSGEHYSGEI